MIINCEKVLIRLSGIREDSNAVTRIYARHVLIPFSPEIFKAFDTFLQDTAANSIIGASENRPEADVGLSVD